jgi:hypothetical protein
MRARAYASRLRVAAPCAASAPCAALALLALLVLALACAGGHEAPDAGGGSSAHAAQQEPPRVQIGLIDWYTDYDAAQAIAAREHKPLLVHFGENPG